MIALLLFGLLRTPMGHSAVEWLVAKATDNQVVIIGLDGALPNQVWAGRIELRDAKGVWLRADQVALDWSALPALWNHVAVHRLTAQRVAVLRRPQPISEDSGATPRIDIDFLGLPVIELSPALAGRSSTLAAQGSLHYLSRHDVSADMAITRARSADRYVAKGAIAADVANGTVTVREGDDGLLGQLTGLPGFDSINLSATASGSRESNTITVTVQAGQLSAQGQGTLSLEHRSADIAFRAEAPAMRLNPALGWGSLAAKGRLSGSFDAPLVQADAQIADFETGAYRATTLVTTINGAEGRVEAKGRLEGLQIPGSAPRLFANAPVLAELSADLSSPQRPLRFSLRHPLARLVGTARTRGTRDADTRLTIASLAPFGVLVGGDIAGSASASLKASFDGERTALTLEGDIRSQGTAIAARLLGHSTLNAHAVLADGDLTTSRLSLDGAGLMVRADGTMRAGRLNYAASVNIKELSSILPPVEGRLALSGKITGPVGKALLAASGTAQVSARGSARERFDIDMRAEGLPLPASATLKARGRLDNAALALDATLSSDGTARLFKLSGNWKSVTMRADGVLPARGAMTGRGALDVRALEDLVVLTGVPAKGVLHMTGILTAPNGRTTLALNGRANDFIAAHAKISRVDLEGAISDLFAQPTLALDVAATGFTVKGWTGEGRGNLRGPLDALVLNANATLRDPQGAPAVFSAEAALDMSRQALMLRQMQTQWRGETLTLAAPARLQFATGLAVDQLRFRGGGGILSLSGRLSPQLVLSLSAQDIRAEALSLFLPQFSASGTLSATAEVTGTLASPQGTITLRGRALRNRAYAVTAANATDLDARAVLRGKTATVTATLDAGKAGRLTLGGAAPLDSAGTLDLRLSGSADLVLLDPLLSASGLRVRGLLRLNTHIGGTFSAPRLRGGANLGNGEVLDYARGIRLHDIEASLTAGTEGIHIVALSARAGSGMIRGSGNLDVWSSGMPVDIALQAQDARPIVSDLLTMVLSGSARLSGKLRQEMMLKGAITVPRAEVSLPQSFPPQVRTLNVRHRGDPTLQQPRHVASLMLDLTVRSSGPVTLRGRGIDADLGGNLVISGSVQAPRIGGGFEMRRGTLTLAGQVLSFSSGRITFDGTSVRGRLNPALNFVASQTSGGVTAILTVTGYASLPKITLSSSPQLPQDEVLARLLFQQSAKQLGPLQLAEGAQALASMAGIGSNFSPLASLRSGLGLDRLSLGSGANSSTTSSATVEAGKYVSRNVYIGARVGLSGETRAQVQVDLTDNLKAQATISGGAAATPSQGAAAMRDSGSSIGLSYQFEY